MRALACTTAILCSIAACNPGPQTITLDAGENIGLKGTVIRDHPDGAEVVSSPSPNYTPGTVLVEVNDTPVRDAGHFRNLLTAASRREGGLKITSAPDAQALEAWRQYRNEQ